MATKISAPQRQAATPSNATSSRPKPTTRENMITAVKVAAIALVSIAALWGLDSLIN